MIAFKARLGLTGAVCAAALGLAAPANAAIVTFSNITGTWYDAVLLDPGTPPEAYSGNGTDNAQVRWGVDTGSGRSGYNFFASGSIAFYVPDNGSSGEVVVGGFQHVNFPVLAPSISSIKLSYTADVDVDGTLYVNKSFNWVFNHDETTNNLDPCPYGGANGQGVNINGCADRVQTGFNASSDVFDIGGVQYTLDVRGFLVGGNPVTQFLTQEGAVNSAFILGQVTTYEAAIPEPASWAMMITGFGLVGATARRRRTAVLVA
jgi:hypothetical protein